MLIFDIFEPWLLYYQLLYRCIYVLALVHTLMYDYAVLCTSIDQQVLLFESFRPYFTVWSRSVVHILAGCFAWFVFLVSRDGWAALTRGATGLSADCDCGISWSYSLTIFDCMITQCCAHQLINRCSYMKALDQTHLLFFTVWLRSVVHINLSASALMCKL